MATRTDAPTRREQILKEAARLFAERGFHGVGVDEIGAAVGISGPGLYRHFAGKDAMLAELLVGISGQLLTGAKRRVAEAGASRRGAVGRSGRGVSEAPVRGIAGERAQGARAGVGGRAADGVDGGAAGESGGAAGESGGAAGVAGGAAGESGGAAGVAGGAAGESGGAAGESGGAAGVADGCDAEVVLDSLIEGHIDFALDDRPLITLHDRELDRLRDSDRKLVRQLQRQYVELWVGVLREVYPGLAEPAARSAVHSVFGLLNSTPHLGRPGALPGRATTAELLHRMARGAFAAAAGE